MSERAIDRDLASCHACGELASAPKGHAAHHARCARCGSPLHLRKPDSVSRTAALLIAATILYIPANALPIMTVKMLGRGSPNTILSGCMHLLEGGMWSLALLVFFASVFVPMMKILGLAFLVWSVHRRSEWRPRERTQLYRVVEAVGRWSMVDVFVIAVLVALVQLQALASIEPGAGATFFAAVVVLTMLAAASFDPRLIWDVLEEER